MSRARFTIEAARRIKNAVLADERRTGDAAVSIPGRRVERPVVLGRVYDLEPEGYRFTVVVPTVTGTTVTYADVAGTPAQWARELNGTAIDYSGSPVFPMMMLGIADGRTWWGFSATGGAGSVMFPVKVTLAGGDLGAWPTDISNGATYDGQAPTAVYDLATIHDVAISGGPFTPLRPRQRCLVHTPGTWGVAFVDSNGDVQLWDVGEVPDFRTVPGFGTDGVNC